MPKGVQLNRARASRQWRWKAGSRVGSNGYVKVRVGKVHPLADPNGWAYEHSVVLAAAGVECPKGWVIHHTNGDKTDNRIENLCIMTRSEHNALHLRDSVRRNATTGRFVRVGKHAAGRLLDGRVHNEFPEVRS